MTYRGLGETDGAFRRRRALLAAGTVVFAAVWSGPLVWLVWTFSIHPPPVPVPW